LWHLGKNEDARAYAERALSLSEKKQHAPTSAAVLAWLTFYEVCDGNLGAVLDYNDRLQTVCSDRGYRQWSSFGVACAEWVAGTHDGEPRHLERLLEATTEFGRLWGGYFTPGMLLLAAGLCHRLNRSREGLELAAAARRFIDEHGERMWEAECCRVTAELLLLSPTGDARQAKSLFLRAMRTARRQQARALEIRALSGLEKISPDLILSRRVSSGHPARSRLIH
jgi:hypothetical protein